MTMMSDALPIGPRRDAVQSVERDIEVGLGIMDMAIDDHDMPMAYVTLQYVKGLRRAAAKLMVCPIHEIPGAAESLREQDRAKRLEKEMG